MVIPFTKKWFDCMARDVNSEEKIKAVSQSFLGRIKVDSDHVYLSRERQEEILKDLLDDFDDHSKGRR